jgi:hypothetical protein
MKTLATIIKRSCVESCNQGRSCAELGVCQNRLPPCDGCDTLHYWPTGMTYHPFAPGVIDMGEADRAESVLWPRLPNYALATAVVCAIAFVCGLSGWPQ